MKIKIIKKSKLIKLLKTKSLKEVAKMYGLSYERIRQICVKWDIPRRGWYKVDLINDKDD